MILVDVIEHIYMIEIPQSPGVHAGDIKWTKVSNPGTNSYSPVGVPQHGTRNITSVLHVLLLRDPTVGSNYIYIKRGLKRS